ncbi:MAG: protein kinase, partial [Actinomycetota bacterium]|nr:protein kinase [Actinomycetota bacterium]
RAKVSDFGIARALDTTQATRTGAYLGTALYSSPEQLQGHKVTPKSDVYSLGTTLYQAAAGEPPFTGTPIEVASQHVSKPPPPLKRREAGLDVGDEMEALILACLAKNAEDRPSAEEAQRRFAEASPTAAVVPETVPAEPRQSSRERPAPTVVSSAGRTGRSGRGRGALAALALVAVLAAIGAFVVPSLLDGGATNTSQNNPSRDQAVAGGSNGEGGGESRESGGDGGDENAPEPTDQNQADLEQTPAPSENEPEQNGQQEQNDSPERAASQAVEEFYTAAAAEDYERSSALLAAWWREEYFPTRSDFEITFDSLRSIRFEGEPTVEVSGDTATVTGQTVATHDDRVERNEGTWTVVKSGDRWIISQWTVDPISSRPT